MVMTLLQQLNQSAWMVNECLLCSGMGSIMSKGEKEENIKSLLPRSSVSTCKKLDLEDTLKTISCMG